MRGDDATVDRLSPTIGDTVDYNTVSTLRDTGWGESRAGPSESVSGHVSARAAHHVRRNDADAA